MNLKLIAGIAAAVVALIIIIVVVYLMIPRINIEAGKNKFVIALCGSCNGALVPNVGADVTGTIAPGKYTMSGLCSALQTAMNSTTQGATGNAAEWSVVGDSNAKTISIYNVNQRSWTFKSVDGSIYETIGMKKIVDNFWVFWNGTIPSSTIVSDAIALQAVL